MSDRHEVLLASLDRLHQRFLVGGEGVSEIWLVRHADAYAGLSGLDDGVLDPPLSPSGHRQSERLGRRLAAAGVSLIWSSDLARARETAEIASRELPAAELNLDPRLREVTTRWDHRDWDSPAWDEPDRAYPFPEPRDEVVARMAGALAGIDARLRVGPGPRRGVAVSHAGTIGVYLSHLFGLEFDAFPVLPQFTSVSVLRLKEDRIVVQSVADIGHLD